MSATTSDRKTQYREGVELEFPVAASTKIPAGVLVCINASTGYAVNASDAANMQFIGVSTREADNSSGSNGDINVQVRVKGAFRFASSGLAQDNVGDVAYISDNQTVVVSGVSHSVVAGRIVKYVSASDCWIEITVGSYLATTAAASVTVADSGSLYTAANVEAALAEVMAGVKTAQYTLFPQEMRLESGAVIPAFANGLADGWTQLSNKEMALRWNDGATPTDFMAQFVMPQDLDDSAAVVLHLMGAIVKAGGAEADSPTFTVEAYFSTSGAAPAADSDCGGTSGEFLTAATNTWQEKTLSIAGGDVPASPSVLTAVFHPTDGELGTDDFILLTPWLEVTRKCLTA